MRYNNLRYRFTILFVLGGMLLHAQSFRAILTGRGEVPPVLTSANGMVTADLVGDTLVVSGSFTGLSGDLATNIAGGAHIHMNYAGRNGGVIFPLHVTQGASLRSGTFNPDSNRFVLNADQLAALQERALYINVHSTTSPGGEIRGQVVPDADMHFATVLYGSNENSLVLSQGHGALVLDVIGDTLTVSGTFNALSTPLNVASAGGMHLHIAYTGQNGGVSIPLNVDVDTTDLNGIISPAKNRFTLTGDQRSALLERRMYANVHSMQYPGGELRGQITPVALAVFRGYLSGMHEIPYVISRAGGMVIAELNSDSTLVLTGSFEGIASGVDTLIAGGAHIHMAITGRNGPVQFPLEMELSPDLSSGAFPAVNVFSLNEAQYAALMNRGLYVNIHSHRFGGGEIRGQLLPESQMAFTANISSIASIPAVRSAAAGLVKAELTGNVLTLSGSMSGLTSEIDTNIAGGSHIHLAAAGSTGPVIFPLNLRFETDLTEAVMGQNRFMLDSAQLRALLDRRLYINVHTHDYPAGEIRGQILPEATSYFFASLAGANETDPVNSDAHGQLILEAHRGLLLTASGSFNGLSGELATNIAGGAHIHGAKNGQNGPVLIPISSNPSPDLHSGVFVADSNRFSVSSGFLDTLYALGLYVNVHSTLFASGEVRGQLLPAGFAHFNAIMHPMNEVQPISSVGAHGAVAAVLNGTNLTVTGTFADLAGDFAANIGGGSHVHGGYTGMNAGIEVPLKTTIAGDLKSGEFRSDTTYSLTAGQIRQLLDGGMYVNVHTTAYPSGEIRGQLLSVFNDFPNAVSEITEPVPNTTIEVSSTSTDLLVVSWTPSEDSDSLAYIVQVTPDPSFSQLAIQYNTGGQTTFSILTLAQIDTLLATAGIPLGFPLNVYARVIASDGSLRSAGEAAPFRLLRVMPSAVRDLPDGWEFSVYPTVTRGSITVDVVAPGAARDEISLVWISPSGNIVKRTVLDNSFQTSREILPTGDLTAGTWVLALYADQVLIGQRKIIVVR